MKIIGCEKLCFLEVLLGLELFLTISQILVIIFLFKILTVG